MKILEKELLAYREKVYNYFEGEDFKIYIASVTNNFFMENYFEAFKTYCLGGKCLRAYLVKLGYELAGGKDSAESIFFASVAYEIFEASVLAHDDIIDQSPLRRGILSMFNSFGGGRIGEARAITIGDVGFFVCYHILKNLNAPPKNIFNAMQLQSEIFIKTCCGQLKDIDLGVSNNYSEADVLNMYEMKTAYYTVIGPLMLGATIAGANKKALTEIKEIGLKLGVLFQAKDDIIGIFGEEKTTGKSNTADIEEGKKTVLTAHFMSHALFKDLALFNKFYGTKKRKSAQIIRELLVKNGSLDYANNFCKDYYLKASDLINNSSFDNENKKKLIEFAKFIYEREK